MPKQTKHVRTSKKGKKFVAGSKTAKVILPKSVGFWKLSWDNRPFQEFAMMSGIVQVRRDAKEMQAFTQTRTPKNLVVFIEDFSASGQPHKIISAIDNNVYHLTRVDSETIRLDVERGFDPVRFSRYYIGVASPKIAWREV